uniref:Histone-lysine N-methyltransferase SETD7 n=1 Tax=Eptatretus burgeri TaxID=7764 RepID=A0A8C4N884_EPTBU
SSHYVPSLYEACVSVTVNAFWNELDGHKKVSLLLLYCKPFCVVTSHIAKSLNVYDLSPTCPSFINVLSSTLHGNFVDDALQGKAFFTNEDGSTIHGTYSDGQLHGYAEEHDPDGRLTFSGHYQNNVRCSLCWIFFPVGSLGEINTLNLILFIYALYGEFVDAEMVSAHPASFHGVEDGKSHFKILKDGPELSFDRSTSTCISSKPLVPDPYEKKRVYVGPSLMPGAGEGLFALSAMEGGTVMAFYNGICLTHEEVDGPNWSLNENTISLDEETVIDVKYDIFVSRWTECLGSPLKGLSHLDDLASVCQFMKKLSKTLAHVQYVVGTLCVR